MGTTTTFTVDVKPANLSLLTHLLRPLYQVGPANSGENALRPASSVPQPNHVLLDVMRAIAVQSNDRVNPQR